MSNTSDIGGSSGATDHEDCPLHDDPREGLCHAITSHNIACKLKAMIFEPGLLPVCTRHNYAPDGKKNSRDDLRAGLCQAVSECGQRCNRPTKYCDSYHFCVYHPYGSTDLPCYFLQLPTELRLMVYRYLFPVVVACSKHHGVKVAILKANRQIHQEASSVLYGESHFETTIHPNVVMLQGKLWKRNPPTSNKENFSMESQLHGCSPNLIQTLDIRLEVGDLLKTSSGIGSHGITLEEYVLYLIRDIVRQFVEYYMSSSTLKGGANALKRLKVSPFVCREFRWQSDETVNAIFLALEPLQELSADHRILGPPASGYRTNTSYMAASNARFFANMQMSTTYARLRDQWLGVSNNPGASSVSRLQHPQPTVQSALRKLDAFAQLLQIKTRNSLQFWTSKAFHDMTRPLHLARVAYENNDVCLIDQIHQAIRIRWLNANRQHQASIQKIKDSITDMLEHASTHKTHDSDDNVGPSLALKYPDEFGDKDLELLSQPYDVHYSRLWSEISTKDSVPPLSDPEVEWKTEGVRVRIRKGDKEWIRLKTQEVVRQLRSEEAEAGRSD